MLTGPSLEPLRKKLASIKAPNFRRNLLRNLAEEGRRQVVMGFARSRDPYGAPWKPLEYRDGNPLLDTGRLRNSIVVAPFGGGIRANTSLVYAATHQYGATITRGKARINIPARPFLPTADKGLGPIWSAAFEKIINEAMRRAVLQ